MTDLEETRLIANLIPEFLYLRKHPTFPALRERWQRMSNLTQTQKEICDTCDAIKELLVQKNRQYGDSALNPCRTFAKSDAVEQIKVRIDDKLNRIQKGAGIDGADEDTVSDLIGYLVLLKIAQARAKA
jgi:hypothetical protein